MTLKVSLKPREEIFINGVWIQNGDRRASLIFHDKAIILKGSMRLAAEDASTPLRKAYLPLMEAYLSGSACPEAARQAIGTLCDEEHLPEAHKLRRMLVDIEKNLYPVLLALYRLIREKENWE